MNKASSSALPKSTHSSANKVNNDFDDVESLFDDAKPMMSSAPKRQSPMDDDDDSVVGRCDVVVFSGNVAVAVVLVVV